MHLAGNVQSLRSKGRSGQLEVVVFLPLAAGALALVPAAVLPRAIASFDAFDSLTPMNVGLLRSRRAVVVEPVYPSSRAIGARLQDQRFSDAWKFVADDRTDVYLQRILDFSTNTKGYRFGDLHEKAKRGVPALMMNRTYPKAVGWEQGLSIARPWISADYRGQAPKSAASIWLRCKPMSRSTWS